ncbi:MAG: SDR family NAD(P)-dependent oxidoreductase [Chloroflexi bacterium]|uniref:SDR family NAD(P)-dependent oxidoreductase n=1 Tax=Candidatus Chlorohelix allophototropha TaxID=3003348 RepID=A0A8T7LZ86_9CHLR|nr:SDR family NAD(P)-dependent oxidoreductase [Chloroflexota bacterium]WJW65763.1 SDR family NAD(P)-dependent oxidoreductase [Chloroflexota bacterium L227-S17]
MELKGKVALITGGGTGLGKEIAKQMAQEGVNVAINYSKSKQEAEETVDELRELGVKAQAIQADVGKLDDVIRIVNSTAESFGRLDILINNAGTTRFVPFTNLDGLSEEDWDDILNINTKAPFFLARATAAIMRQNNGGVIINTASVAGLGTKGSSIAYCTSKAGMIHLTRCLALALAPDNIRVNAVAPGLLLTRWGLKYSPERIAQFEQASPLKKIPGIPDTAATYIMLAKNDSMTGQIITVDAGMLL